MPAASKSTRRSSGGRSGTRKTATKRAASGARKTAPKKSAGGRGTAKGAYSRRGVHGGRAPSRKSASRAGTRARARKTDAMSLLKDDHERVDRMFKKYDRMKEGDERKDALRQQILQELRVHAQVEEELFYPALRAAFGEDGKDKPLELMDEADVEHKTFKWLMAELEGGKRTSSMADARVKVLGEYVKHHVEEEEGQIFKAAKRTGIDFEELGRQMEARKHELMGTAPAAEASEEMAAMGVLGSDTSKRSGTQPGTH